LSVAANLTVGYVPEVQGPAPGAMKTNLGQGFPIGTETGPPGGHWRSP